MELRCDFFVDHPLAYAHPVKPNCTWFNAHIQKDNQGTPVRCVGCPVRLARHARPEEGLIREIKGDLWTHLPHDIIVITTNGIVKQDGMAVMGKGIALEAKERFPGIELTLGQQIKKFGNHVHLLRHDSIVTLFSFPVKNHWRDPASLELIERSAKELAWLCRGTPVLSNRKVVLPRPGCGAGGLKWEDVKPVIQKYFKTTQYTVVDRSAS